MIAAHDFMVCLDLQWKALHNGWQSITTVYFMNSDEEFLMNSDEEEMNWGENTKVVLLK